MFAPVFEEDLVNKKEIEPILPTSKEPRNKRNGIKYFITFFIVSLLGLWNISICRFGIDMEKFKVKEKQDNKNEKDTIEFIDYKDLVYYKSEFNLNDYIQYIC